MGGEPLLYFVSIAAPGEMELRDFKRIFAGMEEASEGARLAGGDTCNTPGPLFISVSVIGQVEKGRAVKRSGARPGDGIWVTGTLGDSAAGLEILKAGGPEASRAAEKYLVSRHLRPEARVKAGRLLGKSGLASSMIDISDGLSSDIRHITGGKRRRGGNIRREDCRFQGNWPHMPAGKGPFKLSLSGGEDYELLFTVRGLKGERGLSALG